LDLTPVGQTCFFDLKDRFEEVQALDRQIPPRERDGQGPLARDISREVVAHHKQHFGRGPTRIKTSFVGDCVLVLMEGGRTPQEELLARCGRFELVAEARSVVLRAVRAEYAAAIERLVGRRVVGFMTDCQPDPDLECQVYVLEPAAE
jgi:uncharacterized protein YbcI